MPEAKAAPARKAGKKEEREATYTELLNQCLDAVIAGDLDREMEVKGQLMGSRFRRTDEQIHGALFKTYAKRVTPEVEKTDDSVDLSQVEQMEYQMDGWILKGDTALTFGSSVAGKTTLEAWKVWNFIQGRNILDRETPCKPGKALIIATDSSAGALKKTFFDLGMNLDEPHPLVDKGPERRLWFKTHAPKQGHSSWVCDLHGVIQLGEEVKRNGINYVVIDSAKSVAANAGWSYSDNNVVRWMLTCIREVVCAPTGCCVTFITHDGKEAGAHAGAKSWKEEVRMATRLVAEFDEEDNRLGTKITFTKDHAAPPGVDPYRAFLYKLDEMGLTVGAEVEKVGTAREVILDVLWNSAEREEESLPTQALITEASAVGDKSRKTLENTLAVLKKEKRVVTPRRGQNKLAPAELERRLRKENQAFSNKRVVSTGGERSKSIDMTTLSLSPGQPPEGGNGGNGKVNEDTPGEGGDLPPNYPRGERPGGCQTPDAAVEVTETPPATPTRSIENGSSETFLADVNAPYQPEGDLDDALRFNEPKDDFEDDF